MTDEEAMDATEQFARKVAAEAVRSMRVSSGRANPVEAFAAIHRGVAAAYSLGYDVGRAAKAASSGGHAISGDEIIARAPHVCSVCGADILPGEAAVRESGIEDGEPFARYTCWACS